MKKFKNILAKSLNRVLLVFFGSGLFIFTSCCKEPIEPNDPIVPLYGVKQTEYENRNLEPVPQENPDIQKYN